MTMAKITLLVVGLLASAPASASPAPRRLWPTVAVEIGRYAEALTVDAEGIESRETRRLWTTRLSLGLAIALRPRWLRVGALRLQSSVGAGLVYQRGHWPLHLRQSLLWEWSPRRWLGLVAGVCTGFQINVSDPTYSYWELGVPLGVRLWFVELLAMPRLVVGLARDRAAVFGGQRERGVATALAPLDLILRVRF